MNSLSICPSETELVDLLEGNLVDPKLSSFAEHLERCTDCQQRASRVPNGGVFAKSLQGCDVPFKKIANQAPRNLVDWIKRIPMLDSRAGNSQAPDGAPQAPDSGDAQAVQDSVPFSADPTPGGLGRLGNYRILKMLGSGGMGSVFLAEDTRLHRHVAVKVMLPKIAADPTSRQRFLREARAAASLRSEHIVTVYQVDEENDTPFLAMELLEGNSLEEVIRSQPQLSVELIIQIAIGVAKGLAYAHEKGLIHRDIKPANIWIEGEQDGLPKVKILDFGLARLQVDDTHLTHVTAIVGTPAFMAPEQARGDKSADARADLFSLGCVLYYLCTGEVPFKAESTLGTLMALAVSTPKSPHERNAAIPVKLSQLTMKLLEKDPAQRLQTARDVLAMLQQIKREWDTGAAEFALPTSQKQIVSSNEQTNRRNPLSFTATAVVAAVGAVLAIGSIFALPSWLANSNSRSTSRPVAAEESNSKMDLSAALADRENQLTQRLYDEFKAGNPQYEGTIRPTFEHGEIVGLKIWGTHIANLDSLCDLKSLRSLTVQGVSNGTLTTIDVSALRGLPLTHLGLAGGYVIDDLEPLRGMPLEELALDYSPIFDLAPLQGMPLKVLLLWSWRGNDLTPLRGLPLEQLNIGGNGKPMNLAPLAGAPLDFLCLNISQVADLSPLKGISLSRLYINDTLVADLSPLQDAPIAELMLENTCVKDLSIAKNWPLTWIEFDSDIVDWYDTLKDVPTLERIKDQPAATVLAEFAPGKRLAHETAFVNTIGMEFALIPHGKTVRGKGNFDEYIGSKEIDIPTDFYLGRYEVTQDEWTKVMGENPSYFCRQGPGADKVACRSDAELARFPVERVSWLDCQEFLRRLNELEDDKDWLYRLPTEAEWTFACQGGPMYAGFDPENCFYFSQPSKTLSHYHANTKLTGFGRTCRVGVYAPNSLGLFDMHGNVFEWCDDLANIPNKRARWIHGGGWEAEEARCSAAFVLEPTEPWTYYDLGLRVARVKR